MKHEQALLRKLPIRRLMVVCIIIVGGLTLTMMYQLHIDAIKHYVTVLEAVDRITDFLYEIQYKCRYVKELGNPKRLHLCQEKDFWPLNGKCLLYSFSLGKKPEIESRLANNGCDVHVFDPSLPENISGTSGPRLHRVGILNTNASCYGTNNWNMLKLASIRKALNHSARYIDVMLLNVDGMYWDGYVERILTNIIKTGEFRCIGQLHVEFRVSGTVLTNNATLKRIEGLMATMMRFYAVGYRTFDVVDNLPKDRNVNKHIMHKASYIVWKISYVNMRLRPCR